MLTSLSKLVNNLSEIYSKECKRCKERSVKLIKSLRDFIRLKKIYIYYKPKECKKRRLTPISGLVNMFWSAYEICNRESNKFVLLLIKGVYSYEYMESWGRFDETLPEKKKLFTVIKALKTLKMLTAKILKKCLKIWLKNLDEYRDLYVQSDTLLLADVFGNFRNKCIEIMNLILLIFCPPLD